MHLQKDAINKRQSFPFASSSKEKNPCRKQCIDTVPQLSSFCKHLLYGLNSSQRIIKEWTQNRAVRKIANATSRTAIVVNEISQELNFFSRDCVTRAGRKRYATLTRMLTFRTVVKRYRKNAAIDINTTALRCHGFLRNAEVWPRYCYCNVFGKQAFLRVYVVFAGVSYLESIRNETLAFVLIYCMHYFS